MQETKFIWMNGNFIPWQDAKIHVLAHALHYGTGVFEGIRTYATAKGPAVFQLEKHIDRFLYGASCLRMQVPYTKQQLMEAVAATIRKNGIKECYVRPIMYYGYGELRVNPAGCPVDAAIAVWPWGAYLGNAAITAKVSKVVRIHPQTSATDAKITGHYVNSMLAGLDAVDAGYTEAIQLDYEGNIAEGTGENFFIVKNGVIATPPLGTILAGITRMSVITLARDLGFVIEERPISLDEALQADECFFTGTATEIAGIGKIDDTEFKGAPGPVTAKLTEAFQAIVKGESEKYYHWLTFVNA
ncbi:MAG: branched-chain amino acid transaminase [Patescibacteria group bacterium]